MSERKYASVYLNNGNCWASWILDGTHAGGRSGITEGNIEELVAVFQNQGYHVSLYRVSSPEYFAERKPLKPYEGCPTPVDDQPARVIIRGPIKNLDKGITGVLDVLASSVRYDIPDTPDEYTRWDFSSEENYLAATNYLHSRGYTPAIRP